MSVNHLTRKSIAQQLGRKTGTRSLRAATVQQLTKRKELQEKLSDLDIRYWRMYCNMAGTQLRVKLFNVYTLTEHDVVHPLSAMQWIDAATLGFTQVIAAYRKVPSLVIYID